MKSLLLLIGTMLLISTGLFGQSGPREVTPAMLKTIRAEVAKETAALKARLEKENVSAHDISFQTDTFRINATERKYMAIDYSTAGMVSASRESLKSYDILLNQYYNLLQKKFKPTDRTTLTAAQKAWINYRDNEYKLIGVLAQDEYSGGGTIQALNIASRILDITQSRVFVLHEYYNATMAF